MALPNASNTELACMIWSSTEPWKQLHSTAHYLSLGFWGFAPRGSNIGKVLDNLSVFSLACTNSPLIGKDQRSKEWCDYTVYMILQGTQTRKQEDTCYPYVISVDWCSRSATTGHERGQTNRVSVREESNCCWFPSEQIRRLAMFSVSTVNNTDSCRLSPDAT